jgi:hypothetical protein
MSLRRSLARRPDTDLWNDLSMVSDDARCRARDETGRLYEQHQQHQQHQQHWQSWFALYSGAFGLCWPLRLSCSLPAASLLRSRDLGSHTCPPFSPCYPLTLPRFGGATLPGPSLCWNSLNPRSCIQWTTEDWVPPPFRVVAGSWVPAATRMHLAYLAWFRRNFSAPADSPL